MMSWPRALSLKQPHCMLKTRLTSLVCLGILLSCSRPDGAASLRDVMSTPVPVKNVSNTSFTADSLLGFNYDDLKKTFGEKNLIVKESESFLEKNNYHIVILFPSTPKQVEIVLQDSTQGANVKAVILNQKSTWPTRAGITPGMTLKQLEELNGKPFLFYGGGWDLGGYVTNWNNGKLQGKVKSCRLDRNHVMPYDLSKGDYDSHEFSSSLPDAQKGNPIIEEITLADY
jgi:hypothetical protein